MEAKKHLFSFFKGSDAAIQLEDFYLELANPLLTDVKFNDIRMLRNFDQGSISN